LRKGRFSLVSPITGSHLGQRIQRRSVKSGCILAVALFLAACGAERQPGELAPVEGFAGVVAGDEPRAVVIGRDVLGNGGTAVDAAVAMYFAMTVTMPSRVGLGGGGVCVLFDGGNKAAQAIDFLPRAAPSGGIVPSGTRAMAALHARYGAVRWEELVSPAETMARFGHAVSRAFAMDIAAGQSLIEANPELRRIFSAKSGALARTGDRIVQDELSTVLSGVRQQGAAYLHAGAFTRRFAEASTAVGMPLTPEDIREQLPRLADAVQVPVGDHVAFFAPPRATGGVVSAQMWGMLSEVEDFADTSADEQPHLFAEAAVRAYAQRAAWMQVDGTSREPLADLVSRERLRGLLADYDPQQRTPADAFSPPPVRISSQGYSAGFVVADQWRNAIACSFTMNRLFGSGRVARGTGMVLAAPPRSPNDGSTSQVATVIGNVHTGDVIFAGTAGDGPAGETALVRVMLESLAAERGLEAALALPRIHRDGAPDEVLYESRLDPALVESLRRRGHRVRSVPALGHVNAFYCPKGLRANAASCQVANDPRGFSLASVVQ